MNDIRALLYPFGFLSSIAFGLRFLLQWLQSEKEHKSISSIGFWKLSLTGNILLFTHCVIQLHYPMCIAQGANAIFAWHNLQLLQRKSGACSVTYVYKCLVMLFISVTCFFYFQDTWLRTPHFSWTAPPEIPFWLHSVGISGIICYSARFWIQWWQTQYKQQSRLSLTFWWLSMIGSVLCTIYFSYLLDWVNLVGPVISFVPFGRNLWLQYRQEV